MLIEKTIQPGYNAYLSAPHDVGMDVGLLVLAPGETHQFDEADKEVAALLLEGACTFHYEGRVERAVRPDCFHYEPWCLHVPRGIKFTVEAEGTSELYIQMMENPRAFAPKLYRPEDVQVQHAGASGELLGAMRREIKTIFDLDNAPESNMVLGEILNFPGKWSSYPPHDHPQREVYFHRFDRPQGFGASFANGEVYTSRHNTLTVIRHGFHSQVAAPGYAMMYVWGIPHLPGNPWRKTRVDLPEHSWLLAEGANEHIFQLED